MSWHFVDGIQVIDLARAHDFIRMFTPDVNWRGNRATRPIYRGQGSAEWKLVPPVFRNGNWLKTPTGWVQTPTETYLDLILAEVATVQEFFRISDRQGLRLPEDGQALRRMFRDLSDQWDQESYPVEPSRGPLSWPPPQMLSLMALAQHSGIATRLLDWSWSPFVAAYFAATDSVRREQGSGGDDFAVWIFEQEEIERNPSWARAYRDWWPVSLVTAPGAEIVNLRAQQGVFTLQRPLSPLLETPPEPLCLETLICEEQLTRSIDWLLRKITLPSSEAFKLLEVLAEMGIDSASLFPGFAGVARAMEEGRQTFQRPQRGVTL